MLGVNGCSLGFGFAGSARGLDDQFSQTEVENFGVPASRDRDVGAGLRSRWMMPSACAASGASGNLGAQVQQQLGFHPLACNLVFQRRSIEELHGDEGPTVLFADVVDRADIGMVQGEADCASR